MMGGGKLIFGYQDQALIVTYCILNAVTFQSGLYGLNEKLFILFEMLGILQ